MPNAALTADQHHFIQCLAHTIRCNSFDTPEQLTTRSRAELERSKISIVVAIRETWEKAVKQKLIPRELAHLSNEDSSLLNKTFQALKQSSLDNSRETLTTPLTILVEGLIEYYKQQNRTANAQEVFGYIISSLSTSRRLQGTQLAFSPQMLCVIDITTPTSEHTEPRYFAVGSTRPTIGVNWRKTGLRDLWMEFLDRFSVKPDLALLLQSKNATFEKAMKGMSGNSCLVWHKDYVAADAMALKMGEWVLRNGCARCRQFYTLNWWQSVDSSADKSTAAHKPPCAESYALSRQYDLICDALCS